MTEMVLPLGHALMVMVFVASVSFKKAVNFGPTSFVRALEQS